MRWKVTRIEAENFRGFATLDLDLTTYRWIALILGGREGRAGRSNGAGKSTVFAAITWALYGITPKKLAKASKIMRRGSTECFVRVTIRIDGSRDLVIERARSARGATLKVSGVDGATTIEGMQAVIDNTVGDSAEFLTTAMFSGEVSSFCRLTDTGRKEMLERMAGHGQFSIAADRAKEHADRVRSEIEVLTSKEASLVERIEDVRASRQQAVVATLKYPLIVERESRRLREKAIKAAIAAGRAAEAVSTWIRTAHAERARVTKLKESIDADIAAAEGKLAASEKAKTAADTAHEAVRVRITDIQTQVSNLETGKHPDICPECGQRWPHEGNVSEIQATVARLKERLFEQEQQRAPLKSAAANCAAEVEENRTLIREHRSRLRTVETAIDERAYRNLLNAASSADAEMWAAQEAYATYCEDHDLDVESEELARIESDLVKSKEALQAVRVDLAEKTEALSHLDFWRRGFGRSGLPSFLIDSAIPDMNHVAAEVASLLTDGELTLSFDSAAEKGASSVFAVNVDYADGGEGYDASSTGESVRVDMAVLFAMRDYAAKRNGRECEQLFFDEIMDGADEHFVESFFAMIRQRYAKRQVFVISHEPSASNLCDQTIRVVKKGKVSSIAA